MEWALEHGHDLLGAVTRPCFCPVLLLSIVSGADSEAIPHRSERWERMMSICARLALFAQVRGYVGVLVFCL